MKRADIPFLYCEHFTFTYPDSLIPALQDISFTLYPGQVGVICGGSGCGKTTLLRHLKKNQVPFGEIDGKISISGRTPEEMDLRESAGLVGYVGQIPDEQIVTDTVWHELAFGMENLGMPTSQIRRRTAETAEYFGISGWFRKRVSALSGGQKQILNLAAVMVMQPELLLLDEPASQLDPIMAGHFWDTLARLNHDFGTTILLAEQQLEWVLPMADQVLLLDQGRLAGSGSPRELPGLLMAAGKESGREPSVLDALPTALRAYIAFGTQEGGKAPVSIREGKEWLRQECPAGGANLPDAPPAGSGDMAAEGMSFGQSGGRKGRKGSDCMIQAEHISFRYGRGKSLGQGKWPAKSRDQERGVLENFSLTVRRGEVFALLGGNGSGKTTALKLLSGICRPQEGTVAGHGRILYLAQDPQSIFTEVTAWEELAEAFEDFGTRSGHRQAPSSVAARQMAGEQKKKVDQMLEWLEMAPYRDQNPLDLSGGQQQRLALGKLLLMEPDVLLMDEPTKGMDASFKKKLSLQLRSLCSQGMTIIIASHDLEFCARNAVRCGLLFDGQVITEGETRAFLADNSFYTTAAKRMTAGILPDCIVWEDIGRYIR